MDWIQVAIGALITFTTAFGGAYYGAELSLRNYYNQKGWDAKKEAYTKLNENCLNLVTAFEQLRKSSTEENFLFVESELNELRNSLSLFDYAVSPNIYRQFSKMIRQSREVLREYRKDNNINRLTAWILALQMLRETVSGIVRKDLHIKS